MTNSKTTKKALLSSALALTMCVAMLIATTFAWFTDTASTSVNKIQAGDLNVDIVDNEGNSLNGKTLSFKNADGDTGILWEPGATFNLDSFKIVNNGNLAFKYKIFVNGVDGNTKLLKAIDFTAKIGDSATTVELDALEGKIVPADKTPGEGEVEKETGLITISGTMKTTAGNEYQGLSIDGIGITVVATQYTYESDSSNNQYDEDADTTIQVNTGNIQDYLDGKYGTIDGATLVLASGDYGKLELGRATKYAGSNTQYHVNSYSSGAMTLEQLAQSSGTRYYIRTMSNITFKPAEGADVNVAGLEMICGHHSYDYVEDKNNNHYEANKAYNITFDDITFTSKCYVDGSDSAATVINGFTFKNCKFNIDNTGNNEQQNDKAKYQAINYRKESPSVVVKNLVVDNCEFNNCYQGVYTQNVYDVTVNNCIFNTTGHNAIAIQDDKEKTRNHGAVVITNNTFSGVPKPVIRFGSVGSDTQITIKNNRATNCGEAVTSATETTSYMVIEANTLAAGVTYSISSNTWETNAETYTLPRTFSHDVFKNK